MCVSILIRLKGKRFAAQAIFWMDYCRNFVFGSVLPQLKWKHAPMKIEKSDERVGVPMGTKDAVHRLISVSSILSVYKIH